MAGSALKSGLPVLFGGFMMHLTLGCAYLWGGIQGYVASYLHQYDDTATVKNMFMVLPIQIVCLNLCLPLAFKLADKLGIRLTLFLGLSLVSISALVASFLQNFWAFVFLFPTLGGFGGGMTYTIPIRCGWKYYPDKKGLVSGIIVAGFGVGPFLFNFITAALVNPDDIKADKDTKLYPESVYENVPAMFRWLALMWFALSLFGIALVRDPEAVKESTEGSERLLEADGAAAVVQQTPVESSNQCMSVREGLSTRQYITLVSMAFLSLSYSLFLIAFYKTIGTSYGFDDFFMTTVGAVGLFCNGAFRTFWGKMMDIYDFKRVFGSLLIVQGACILLMAFTENYAATYAIAVIISLFCEGGHFALFPGECGVFFGGKLGTLMYTFVFAGFSLAGLVGILFDKVIQPALHNKNMFFVFLGMTVAAAALLYTYDNKIDWKTRRQRKTVASITDAQFQKDSI